MEAARLATRDDVDRLAELWDAADAELGVQRGGERLIGSIARPLPDHLLGAGPDRLVAVGTIDGYVVGFAYASVDRRPRLPVALVEVIFVEGGARGVGLGEALMGAVLRWAGERGCGGIDGYALPGNRAAKALFEAHGFSARLLVMHRP